MPHLQQKKTCRSISGRDARARNSGAWYWMGCEVSTASLYCGRLLVLLVMGCLIQTSCTFFLGSVCYFMHTSLIYLILCLSEEATMLLIFSPCAQRISYLDPTHNPMTSTCDPKGTCISRQDMHYGLLQAAPRLPVLPFRATA